MLFYSQSKKVKSSNKKSRFPRIETTDLSGLFFEKSFVFSYPKNEQPSSICKFKSARKIISKVESTVDACPSAIYFHPHNFVPF